ncbi:helix-turn-helix domain-containing protein [bacterium]|jgi:predicted DNA-binding transcriptional regulator AlpA|nr:helix-turn-helix domain-containing protein [bacterium]
MEKYKYLSIPEVAKLLGISRIAVYKKVKKGQIQAEKIGRAYAVPREIISSILGDSLDDRAKKEINEVVEATMNEYGETLRLLGKE